MEIFLIALPVANLVLRAAAADLGLSRAAPRPLKVLQRVALWLTPKVIAKYGPADFSGTPEGLQERLRHAVERFREALAAICPGQW